MGIMGTTKNVAVCMVVGFAMLWGCGNSGSEPESTTNTTAEEVKQETQETIQGARKFI